VNQELYRRVYATLVRVLGDWDLAEEATQDAFTAAVEKWDKDGIPRNPYAWLVSAGRFKTIDRMRRRARFDDKLSELALQLEERAEEQPPEDVEDDRLRLIFTCCHPALPSNVQVALTLREVCGLRTEEIASAFLTTPVTMAQRIVRGKARIKEAQLPYQVPGLEELPERLESVLSVIYLVFNEGYYTSHGDALTRADLSQEAIRLGRLLVSLLPDPEARGLLALMLLQESRRRARTDEHGDVVLLEDQDRSLWDRDLIAEGLGLIGAIVGPYTAQAAIAAEHARGNPNWSTIIEVYDLLGDSPIIRLNRAVAVAMRDGPEKGLQLIDQLLPQLQGYHLAHAAKADLHRRLDQTEEARRSYHKALELAGSEPEKRFLRKRLSNLPAPDRLPDRR